MGTKVVPMLDVRRVRSTQETRHPAAACAGLGPN